jgi:hypothetical protein
LRFNTPQGLKQKGPGTTQNNRENKKMDKNLALYTFQGWNFIANNPFQFAAHLIALDSA